jgi:hypothetical protein
MSDILVANVLSHANIPLYVIMHGDNSAVTMTEDDAVQRTNRHRLASAEINGQLVYKNVG